MKYTEEDYLNEPWFQGDESDISCKTVKMVITRKEHQCWLSLTPGNIEHNIPTGSYAYFEKALIDKSYWAKFYMCTDCMDKAIDEVREYD